MYTDYLHIYPYRVGNFVFFVFRRHMTVHMGGNYRFTNQIYFIPIGLVNTWVSILTNINTYNEFIIAPVYIANIGSDSHRRNIQLKSVSHKVSRHKDTTRFTLFGWKPFCHMLSLEETSWLETIWPEFI